ncbi:hypothetical protein QLX08_009344 [Tetragonisca angustula]|uniref:Reverse transcriptase zinc-binding domain-containing protein n=1 Tax=Tetragonisca angustula TaxID=166442 RepID=A0AAW0ZG95_9HYME
MWQAEWRSSDHGRITREFFADVRSRLKLESIKISHHTSQILTGHGNINSMLHRFKLSETDLCHCGQPDTVEHIIYHCKEEKVERAKMIEEIEKQGVRWPCTLSTLSQRTTFEHLSRIARGKRS